MAELANIPKVEQRNVARLAERIVANELEWRGFRVSDLNKDGLSPNVDLIAAGHGRVWQIQVKGASNKQEERWWVHYGYCTPEIVERQAPMFNRPKLIWIATTGRQRRQEGKRSPTKCGCIFNLHRSLKTGS